MKSAGPRAMALKAFGVLLAMLFPVSCLAPSPEQRSPDAGVTQEIPRALDWEQYLSRPLRWAWKTTMRDCEVRGGSYWAHPDPLPEDLVECVLPLRIQGFGPPRLARPSGRILASVYDYLYRGGTERPGYGLYSYVIFPVPSPRAERFLDELFKTTGFVEITSAVSLGHLNVMYLPTRAEKLSMLRPVIVNGSPPSVSMFGAELYDYRLAQRLLTQICAVPSEAIQATCKSDLSRGPYLFTYTFPASTLSQIPPPYLVLDLSRVHERAFGEFVSAYKEQVKRTDYTDLERIANLRLRLLSVVLTAADWIDPIKGAMAEILHLAGSDDQPNKPAR